MKRNILAIIFNCHCLPERSFHFRGRQFPLCARCTGVLLGYIAGIASAFFFVVSWYWALVLMVPLVADGSVQQWTKYESNNIKRVVTGLTFGFATIHLIVNIHFGTVEMAKALLRFLAK